MISDRPITFHHQILLYMGGKCLSLFTLSSLIINHGVTIHIIKYLFDYIKITTPSIYFQIHMQFFELDLLNSLLYQL